MEQKRTLNIRIKYILGYNNALLSTNKNFTLQLEEVEALLNVYVYMVWVGCDSIQYGIVTKLCQQKQRFPYTSSAVITPTYL